MSSSPPQVDTSKPMWDAQAPTPGQAPMQSPYQPIQNYQGAFGFQGPSQAQYGQSFPQQQQQQQQQPSPMGKGMPQGGFQELANRYRNYDGPNDRLGNESSLDFNPPGARFGGGQEQMYGFRGINGSM